MKDKGRIAIAAILFLAAIGLMAYGVSMKMEVFYAQPAPQIPDPLVDPLKAEAPGDQNEDTRFITGSNHQLWQPDKSRSETINDIDLLDHSTVSGVARTSETLHLTGLDACPT